MKKLLFLAGLLVVSLQMNAGESPDILETFGSAKYLEQRHDLQNQLSEFKNGGPILYNMNEVIVPYGSSINDDDLGSIQYQLYNIDRDELNRIVNKSAQWVSDNSAEFTKQDGTKMIVENPMANVYELHTTNNTDSNKKIVWTMYTFAYSKRSLMPEINLLYSNTKTFGNQKGLHHGAHAVSSSVPSAGK